MYIWILGGEEMDQRFVKKKDAGIMKKNAVKSIPKPSSRWRFMLKISLISILFFFLIFNHDFIIYTDLSLLKTHRWG